jgi:hypothetical protein
VAGGGACPGGGWWRDAAGGGRGNFPMFDCEEMPRGWPHGDRILCNFCECLVWRTELNKLLSAHFVAHRNNNKNFCWLNFLHTKVSTSSVSSRWLMEVNQLSSTPIQANIS